MEIKRDQYLGKLVSHQHNGMVKVITGIRRCGKSYLLFTIFRNWLRDNGVDQDHIIEVDFEDYDNATYRDPKVFYAYVKKRIQDESQYYILLDEVQRLGEFEDVLNGLLRRRNLEIYVTGSNARFLSSDIITEFRGRGDQIHVMPLSFSEFLSVQPSSKTKEQAWLDYITYGGLPQVVLTPTAEEKNALLNKLLQETYLTDILERNKIKNNEELEDLLNVLASNIGSLTNNQRLSDTFKSVKGVNISGNTIKKYIDCFIDAFLLERCDRYDVKGRKYIGASLKYYFTDLGLRNARLNFRQIEYSHLMENVLYNEMKRRGYGVDVGIVMEYVQGDNGKRTKRQREVDFVCNKGSERIYIQSALSIENEEKNDQETRSLSLLTDNFDKVVVIGSMAVNHQDDNGIRFINLFDFLLRQ